MKKSEGKESFIKTVACYHTEGTCDVCGKLLWDHTYRPKIKGIKDQDVMYYEVSMSHNDWGNDSVESIETYDVCPDCLTTICQKYLENPSMTKEFSVECAFPPTNLEEFDEA